jgi:aldehyde dehydrogenase (NAD+)
MSTNHGVMRDTFFINGAWASPSAAGTIDVYDSGMGTVMGSVPEGGVADIQKAVAAARAAFDEWSRSPIAKRADFLARISAGLQARSQEIAVLVAREVGMPVKQSARIQVGAPVLVFASYAKAVCGFTFEQRVGNSLVLREPVGVVGAITPWNYPLFLAAEKTAAALAAGCTVILKPSEVAPFSAFVLAEVIQQAGLPPGVFNVVTGYGPVVGEALVQHPDVDAITFTGSTRAGRRVSELAAASVKRVKLELGGKSASVILEDADLASAITATMGNCFLNSGQTCMALTRMLVPESRYAEAAAAAVQIAQAYKPGSPLSEGTLLGPLASAAQLERVRAYIRKGIDEGAELLTGGPDAPPSAAGGYYVNPTVFGRVDPRSTIAQEEIFGPVLSIIPYKDEEDALRIANDTMYGLAAAVWSGSEDRARRVARRIRAGQITVNGGPINLEAPFGGFKQSGHGREWGVYGMEEFLEYKSMQLRTEA